MSFFIPHHGHFSIISRFFERKAHAKVGKFTFVSTKLASKRAIKSSGANSRLFFQSIAIKRISRTVSRARAQHEIPANQNASFPSEKVPENWSLGLVASTVATKAILVKHEAKQIILYCLFHWIFGPRRSSSSSVHFLAISSSLVN